MSTLKTRLPIKFAKTTAALQEATGVTSKYLNKKVTLDGRTFHSKKESLRYLVLKDMERKGEITDLKCQPRYALIVNGRRVCSYIGDFSYLTRAGLPVTEDVKSEFTAKLPEFRVKFKLFRAVMGRDIVIV